MKNIKKAPSAGIFRNRFLIKTLLPILVSAIFLPGVFAPTALAAVITSYSDTLSRLQASTLADHEIKFVTPSGVNASTSTITLTFGAGFSVGAFALLNFDLAAGNSSSCSGATFTEKTLAGSASSGVWGVGGTSTVTLTPPTNATTGELAAGNCIRIRIGANAAQGGAGASIITNGTAANSNATVTVGGAFGDSGVLFIPLITSDQVSISATVNPTLSFSLSTTSIAFGTLVTGNARFATNDMAGSSTELSAHTLAAGTNAASGFVVAVLGATLTSASNTITSIGGTMASSTPGSEQFGLRMTASGGIGSVTIPYNASTSYAFGATATSTSQVGSAAGPSASTTYTVYYVANIATLTEAGSYTTTLTYTATSNF